MSELENTPDVPESGATEGADSPVADVKEVVTATTEDAPAKVEKTPEQKRLAELAYEAREARRQKAAADEAMTELKQQLEDLKAGKGNAPAPDAFESYDEYLRELTKWEVRQELSQHQKKSEEGAKKAKAFEERERKAARLESVVTSGAESYKDFHATLQALDSAVANPEELRGALDVVLESDKASDLIYYLGKNPSVVASLTGMSAIQQAREIGRLEEKLQSKKLTAAPAPVETLKGTGGRVTSDTPPSDPAKYREWRAKQRKG